jgi:hypothetical protein
MSRSTASSIFDHQHVFGQGSMHTVFKLRSLTAKHHPGARQLAGIAHRGRKDLRRRQFVRSLQPVHPLTIELVAFIHAAHHQFGQPRVYCQRNGN